MRVHRAAAILALLIAGPVVAQGIQKPAAPTDPPKSTFQIESEKSADSAYKKSLSVIPDKPAADPWGGARAVEESKPAPSSKRTKASAGGTTN